MALATTLPEGLAAAPVLEVANGRTGEAWFLLAVHREGETPALRVELWRLDQNNEKGLLTAASTPTIALRLARQDDHAAPLDALRRELATPGNEVTRPRGLPVKDAAALLDELARAAATARDPKAPASDRVDALATLLRGLGDPIVLERDVVYEVLEALAQGPWVIADEAAQGARRVRLRIAGPGAPRELDLERTRDGWVLHDLRDAPTEATEPAPPSAAP